MSRRLRCQLRKPSRRLDASSENRGVGSGARWGSERCASVNMRVKHCLEEWRPVFDGETATALRTADQDACQKDENAAHDDLERGPEERRVHIAIANIGNGGELHRHHRDRDDGRGNEMWNQVGEGVTGPPERG